jgi:hypothetical protein
MGILGEQHSDPLSVTIHRNYIYCEEKALSDRHAEPHQNSVIASYGNTIKPCRFFDIPRFLHFSVNKSEPGKRNKKF